VVLDTNVLFSAFATPSGAVAQIVTLLQERGEPILFTSTYILDEFERIYILKHHPDVSQLRLAIETIEESAVRVYPIPIGRIKGIDANDLPILGTAVAARAEYLVTGDRALLRLKNYYGTKIITPRAFLKILSVQ